MEREKEKAKIHLFCFLLAVSFFFILFLFIYFFTFPFCCVVAVVWAVLAQFSPMSRMAKFFFLWEKKGNAARLGKTFYDEIGEDGLGWNFFLQVTKSVVCLIYFVLVQLPSGLCGLANSLLSLSNI